jgi:hypothetical protein
MSGYYATWNKHAMLEFSANLIEEGKFQKIHANFQAKIFDNFGRIVKIYPVTDPQYYNQFFSKITEALITPRGQ